MRDAWIHAMAIVIAGIIVGWTLVDTGYRLGKATRYEIAAAGESVAVVDRRTGYVQTFERTAEAPRLFRFVGSDGRERARRREQPGQPEQPE